ncbi:MAG: NlpC/P60 family protein [Oligoflexales bacterium]
MLKNFAFYFACSILCMIYFSEKSIAATYYYKISTEDEVHSPDRIYWSEAKQLKGRYFALKYAEEGPYKNYFFANFNLLEQFLLERNFISQGELIEGTPIIKIALELMKSQKDEISLIRTPGREKGPLQTQFEFFINQPYYWFSSSSHQELNGYISGGTGLNFCSGLFDMKWGLDCSGFIYFAHRLNKTCFPRFRSDNLWVLFNPSFADAYDMYDYETLTSFFEETSEPAPGDLVLFDGHISLYLNEALSIGQSSYGIAFEAFKNRKRTDENINGIKPHHVFFKIKEKNSNQCNDITVDRYKSEDYRGSQKAYNKHFQGLYFSRETGNVILSDYKGNGSRDNLCAVSKPSNDSIYPQIENYGDFGVFHTLREENSSRYDIMCEEDEIVSGVKFKDHGDKHVVGIYCLKSSQARWGKIEYIQNNNLPGRYYDRYCSDARAAVVGIRFNQSESDSRMEGFYCQETEKPLPDEPFYRIKVDEQTGDKYGAWCSENSNLVGFYYKDAGDDHIVEQLCIQN